MFSYVSLEQRVPADHPLRAVRKLTDAVLGTLSPEFDALYAASRRTAIDILGGTLSHTRPDSQATVG